MLAADDTEHTLDSGIEHLAALVTEGQYRQLEAGDQLGDFEIISEIGRGGMGVVYAARDRKLGRVAALKVLPLESRIDPHASDGLIAEAQAASALDHPNVATIYQVGETTDGRRFIAMARYEGETLRQRLSRGPIPPREAFDIARQIASGLAAAHAVGLVHRDVKPENIFLTRQGLAKLLDFGIATLAGSAREGPTTRGTVLYMSPEQAHRKIAGPASDVWSLGVVLYEMLTGETPFAGATPAEILEQIGSSSPVRLPQPVRRIPSRATAAIARSLEKDSSKRFADASSMNAELSRVNASWSATRNRVLAAAAIVVLAIAAWIGLHSRDVATRSSETPILAVLPFAGDSSDKEISGLASALRDEIAARVVGLRRVKMVGLQKDSAGSIVYRPGLHLLKMDVRTEGNAPIVKVTLENAKTGTALWSEERSFDRANLREISRDMVIGILAALGRPASERERAILGNAFPSSAEAYAEFLQANRLLAIRTPSSVESALAHYRRATTLDSTFASAFARQSYAYSLLLDWGWTPPPHFPQDPMAEGLALVDRATALDSTSADAWLARAYLLVIRDPLHMTGAVEAFQRAITLNPYNAEAYHQYGQTLMPLGRYTEALAAYRRVIDLEPDRAMTFVPMAAIYQREGQLAEGLRMLDSAISAAPRVPYARATRAIFRAQAGDLKGAREDAELALALDPTYPVPALTALAKALWLAGDTAQALRRLHQAEAAVARASAPTPTESFWLGRVEVALGRIPQATALLRNTRPRSAQVWFLYQDRELEEFRKIPEVKELLDEMDPRKPAA